MNDSDSTKLKLLQNRVTKLEETQAHDQHVVDQLSDVIHKLSTQIDTLRSTIDSQQARIKDLTSRIPEEPRTLEDDKPPHY